MRPAFSSTNQAAAFALLLLLLLAAPWLADKTLLARREETYSSESIRFEKFPWVQKFIFEETNDIDIAFVGSSHMTWGIDTPYVQQKLDERLGRKSVVRTIGWKWSGFDTLYFFTRELLAHRRVKTLVFHDECDSANHDEFHTLTPEWFRFGDDGGVLSGLPLKDQAVYYYATVIGTPRNVLALWVPNLPNEPGSRRPTIFDYARSPNPELRLGCMTSRLGFGPDFANPNTNFTPYVPQTGIAPADILVYASGTASNFVFSDQPRPATQLYFAKQFGLLAKKYGCNLVELHLPAFAEKKSPVITESRNWPDLLQTDVYMMGIPGGRLFAGLTEQEVKRLYLDPGHFNANGQQYFTPLITPELLNCYENHSHH